MDVHKGSAPSPAQQVRSSNAAEEPSRCDDSLTDFARAACDTMIDHQGRLWLLEFNVNPVAPPKDACSPYF